MLAEWCPKHAWGSEKLVSPRSSSAFHTVHVIFFMCSGGISSEWERWISQNCNGKTFLFAFAGHVILLSGAGATVGCIASHNSSKTEQIILKFWIDGSTVKSYITTSQKSHSKGAWLSSIAPITCLRCLRLAVMAASASPAMEVHLPEILILEFGNVVF